jgi:LemA protein
MDYNTKIKVFPNVLIARLFNFSEEEFFDAEEEAEKDIKVEF